VATGVEFDHQQVLEGRRPEYVEDVLGYRIVETTEFSKPYNNLENVNSARDGALLQAIEQHHDERPAVISSSRAVVQWDRADVLDLDKSGDRWTAEAGPVDGVMRYGNLLGSNRFTDRRVGAVVGSNHYGDGAIGRWAAYAGEAAALGDDARPGDGWSSDLDYGRFGNKVLEHMHSDTLQAVFRFGRDADGATVYVETDTLPEWVPVHGRGEVETLTGGVADTVTALTELGTATTEEIAEHEAVDIVARRVRGHLATLRDLGALSTRPDPDDGRRDLHELTDDSAVTPLGVSRLPGDETGENSGESSGRILYSSTIEKVSAKSDGGEPPGRRCYSGTPATLSASSAGETVSRRGRAPARPAGASGPDEPDRPEPATDGGHTVHVLGGAFGETPEPAPGQHDLARTGQHDTPPETPAHARQSRPGS
jgi:hypothetical protein